MTPDTPPADWLALLEVVVECPVRRTVKPAGLPTGADEALLAEARKAAGLVPELARLLGIPIPPPPGPRRPVPARPAGRPAAPPEPAARRSAVRPGRAAPGDRQSRGRCITSSRALKPADSKKLLAARSPGRADAVDPGAALVPEPGRATRSSSRWPRPTSRAPGSTKQRSSTPAVASPSADRPGTGPHRPPSRPGCRPGPSGPDRRGRGPPRRRWRLRCGAAAVVGPGQVRTPAVGPRSAAKAATSSTSRSRSSAWRVRTCSIGTPVARRLRPAQDRSSSSWSTRLRMVRRPRVDGLVGPHGHQLGPAQPVEALDDLGGRQGVEPGDGQTWRRRARGRRPVGGRGAGPAVRRAVDRCRPASGPWAARCRCLRGPAGTGWSAAGAVRCGARARRRRVGRSGRRARARRRRRAGQAGGPPLQFVGAGRDREVADGPGRVDLDARSARVHARPAGAAPRPP